MKESYCVYIGRVHIYYLIKPCFVLLCFDSEQIRPATFFGYNWDRDLILRPGWQEKSSAPFELCRTRLQINDDTRKNLKRGRPLSLFIHQCLSVRTVSWQWSTPGDQHTRCSCGTPGSREKNHPLRQSSRSPTDRKDISRSSQLLERLPREVDESCILGPSLGPASIHESSNLWVLHTGEVSVTHL